MKGNPEVIKSLNEALSEELTAINQYFVHAEMYESWGYKKLAELNKKMSIDEMKHAEELIERILFLDGKPNMAVKKLSIGAAVPDMLKNDMKLESMAVKMYNDLIVLASQNRDQGTVELYKKLLDDEEGHLDGFEEQLDQIKDMGIQVYLSVQM
ncbi:MAG: bacterioferritin [Acidobacteria bacterium]|nr:bacterioferritin [Acidobacteriota bacterium]